MILNYELRSIGGVSFHMRPKVFDCDLEASAASGKMSPQGGTFRSPGRTCEGVASERSETRSPKPRDKQIKISEPRAKRVGGRLLMHCVLISCVKTISLPCVFCHPAGWRGSDSFIVPIPGLGASRLASLACYALTGTPWATKSSALTGSKFHALRALE